VSQLTASFAWATFDAFASWAEERTGGQNMRHRVLATFAAAAFRSGDASHLTVSVLSIRGGAKTFRNPDLRGLGEPEDSAAESSHPPADLTLVDLTGTRLTGYQPPARSGYLTVVFIRGSDNDAVATLHFCEDDLPLLNAARFLDSFAERIEEPATQLL
jgi:hypothetical protein